MCRRYDRAQALHTVTADEHQAADRADDMLASVRLAAYFAEECDPGERGIVEAWIAAEPGRAAWVALLRQAWETSADPWGTRAHWRAAQAKLGLARAESSATIEAPVSQYSQRRHHRPWRDQVWSVAWAAAATVVVLVGGSLVVTGGPIARLLSTHGTRTYATARAERASVTLDDGTRLVLAPASEVRVLDGGRHIALRGEALFTVRHDPQRPFVVVTAHSVTQDIGTTFVVRDYAADHTAQVAVSEGRVVLASPATSPAHDGSMRAADQSAVLAGGQVGEAAPGRAVLVQAAPDLAPYVAWATGALVFKRTPLRDVAADLSRWYDLDVSLDDPSLGSLDVTATYREETSGEVLDAIAAALGLRYERHGHSVVIRRAGAA